MKDIIPNIGSFDISFKRHHGFILFKQLKSSLVCHLKDSLVCQFIANFDYVLCNLIRGQALFPFNQ